jgi:hypothetical protein
VTPIPSRLRAPTSLDQDGFQSAAAGAVLPEPARCQKIDDFRFELCLPRFYSAGAPEDKFCEDVYCPWCDDLSTCGGAGLILFYLFHGTPLPIESWKVRH